jgi:hypothetical protein
MKKMKSISPTILLVTYIFAAFAMLLLQIGVVFPAKTNDIISMVIFLGAVAVSAVLVYKKGIAAPTLLPLGTMIAIYATSLQLQYITFDPSFEPSAAAYSNAVTHWFTGFFTAYSLIPLVCAYCLLYAVYLMRHEKERKAER